MQGKTDKNGAPHLVMITWDQGVKGYAPEKG